MEVKTAQMFGFACDLNTIMRSVNGNGKRRLLFGHQNMRGGTFTTNKDKRDQIELSLGLNKHDVLGISETELGPNPNGVCNIDGYVWETKVDSPRISVLINDNLDYKRRQDLEVDGFAVIWVEVNPKNKNSITAFWWEMCTGNGKGKEWKRVERR